MPAERKLLPKTPDQNYSSAFSQLAGVQNPQPGAVSSPGSSSTDLNNDPEMPENEWLKRPDHQAAWDDEGFKETAKLYDLTRADDSPAFAIWTCIQQKCHYGHVPPPAIEFLTQLNPPIDDMRRTLKDSKKVINEVFNLIVRSGKPGNSLDAAYGTSQRMADRVARGLHAYQQKETYQFFLWKLQLYLYWWVYLNGIRKTGGSLNEFYV